MTRGKRFYPEFILCASSEILHSTGLLLSSVLWVKHAILKKHKSKQIPITEEPERMFPVLQSVPTTHHSKGALQSSVLKKKPQEKPDLQNKQMKPKQNSPNIDWKLKWSLLWNFPVVEKPPFCDTALGGRKLSLSGELGIQGFLLNLLCFIRQTSWFLYVSSRLWEDWWV